MIGSYLWVKRAVVPGASNDGWEGSMAIISSSETSKGECEAERRVFMIDDLFMIDDHRVDV